MAYGDDNEPSFSSEADNAIPQNNANFIDLGHINLLLIRDNIILPCKEVFLIDQASGSVFNIVNNLSDPILRLGRPLLTATRSRSSENGQIDQESEFLIVNKLLDGIFVLDRSRLSTDWSHLCANQQIDEALSNQSTEWAHNNRTLFVVPFLPILSKIYRMTFHECRIVNHVNHGRIFEAVDPHDNISTGIYYLCNSSQSSIVAVFITEHSYSTSLINHIHEKLSCEEIEAKKVALYERLISVHVEQAQKIPFHQHLRLLSKWQDIYRYFLELKKIEWRMGLRDTLLYCRCLIMLSKYSEAERELVASKSRTQVQVGLLNNVDWPTVEPGNIVWLSVELHLLLAKTKRKYKNPSRQNEQHCIYREARQNLPSDTNMDQRDAEGEARRNLPSDTNINQFDEVSREIKLIEKSIERTLTNKQYEPVELSHRQCPKESYNILSIDGGGIRGLIPAIWLQELEQSTGRTCSSMFQMMTGTSTGAIIVAGLSTRDQINKTQLPYTASRLVQLYKNSGRQIFVDRPLYHYRRIPLFMAPKYSHSGREALFKGYFQKTTLGDCLTDILIPTVRGGDNYTHLFMNNGCFRSTSLVDVLMATTAAPTFFKQHCINGVHHLDGGVQMNNPTMAAYTNAIENGYDRTNIFVLSLGTGDYVQDALKPTHRRNATFYALNHKHVVKTLLDSHQNNVDYQMSQLLDDNHYYRWQTWYENPIELDQYEQHILNQLENIAYEYWEEMLVHDGNRLNRLIKHLSQ